MDAINKKARILFLTDYYLGPLGGTEGQIRELMIGLKNNSAFDVRMGVLRGTEYTDNPDSHEWPVVDFNITRLSRPGVLVGMTRMFRYLVSNRIDILHIFFNDSSLIGPLVGKIAGCKVIVSRRDLGIWYTPGYLRALSFVNRFINLVIANSDAVKKVVFDKEKIDSDKIKVIYNGLIESENSAKAKILPFSRDENKISLGLVANIRAVKRHDLLFDALAIVLNDRSDLHLYCVGGVYDEPYMKLLNDKIDTLKLESTVTFVGSVDDASPYMSLIDIAVLCSDSEGFSNTVMEYMHNGLPVLATSVGGNPELIDNGETGLLVPPGDIKALAEAIMSLVDAPELRQRIGTNARKKISKYTVPKMVDEHIHVYNELINRG